VSRLRFCDIRVVQLFDLGFGVGEFAVGLEFYACGVATAADIRSVEARDEREFADPWETEKWF
jgi:hypothetical protein